MKGNFNYGNYLLMYFKNKDIIEWKYSKIFLENKIGAALFCMFFSFFIYKNLF